MSVTLKIYSTNIFLSLLDGAKSMFTFCAQSRCSEVVTSENNSEQQYFSLRNTSETRARVAKVGTRRECILIFRDFSRLKFPTISRNETGICMIIYIFVCTHINKNSEREEKRNRMNLPLDSENYCLCYCECMKTLCFPCF